MKRFVDYFTLRNVVMYVVFSFLIGGLTFSLGGMFVFMYRNPSPDELNGLFILYIFLTFVCVFLFLLLVYGFARLLLCHSAKGRKAVRIIYSAGISLPIAYFLSDAICRAYSQLPQILYFVLIAAFCFVVALFIFKHIQDKTYRYGY